MQKVLRRDIMKDNGNSTLKKRALDLITNLRLENQVLQETKKHTVKKETKTE